MKASFLFIVGISIYLALLYDERLVYEELILKAIFFPIFQLSPLVFRKGLPKVNVLHGADIESKEYQDEIWKINFLRWGMDDVMEEIKDFVFYFTNPKLYNYKRDSTKLNFTIPCSDGSGDHFSLIVFSNQNAKSDSPAIVFFHGGGMMIGHPNMYEAYTVGLETQAVVVSVGYRLAPEKPFPAGLNDCYDGLRWTIDNSERIGIDPKRIAVAGSSAGGLMAAAVTLRARKNNLTPKLKAQYLHIPVLRYAGSGTVSWNDFFHSYALNAELMSWFWSAYSVDKIECFRNEECSPAIAQNFTGLPPAVILTAVCDILRDEGEIYANSLRREGVNVYHRTLKHTHFGASAVVSAELIEGLKILRNMLASP